MENMRWGVGLLSLPQGKPEWISLEQYIANIPYHANLFCMKLREINRRMGEICILLLVNKWSLLSFRMDYLYRMNIVSHSFHNKDKGPWVYLQQFKRYTGAYITFCENFLFKGVSRLSK